MKHISLPSRLLGAIGLAAIFLLPAAYAASEVREEGVWMSRQPFVEVIWESVNASRYEVLIGSRRVMAGTQLSHLLDGAAVPDGLSVQAVRFEGDGEETPFTEVSETIAFEVRTVARYVIDWDETVYDRPYIGVLAGYEGPVNTRGPNTHMAMDPPFRIDAAPDQVRRIVFAPALEDDYGARSAPFTLSRVGLVAHGPLVELKTP